ncbi:hypothetical protein B0H67DRAFT_463938, partial [Lasiosphaeris hirsuta]
MCYFDQDRWSCGYWKWGIFRQQCNKEYRTGETCGLKLVCDTVNVPGTCRICDMMEKKKRRMRKFSQDIKRWESEGNRQATIEYSNRCIAKLTVQIDSLSADHSLRVPS